MPSDTRVTIVANNDAGLGQLLSCWLGTIAGAAITVERPMYFNYFGQDGVHDVVGCCP